MVIMKDQEQTYGEKDENDGYDHRRIGLMITLSIHHSADMP